MQETTQSGSFVRADADESAWQEGWYGIELDGDGQPYRWSQSKAVCRFLSASAGPKRVRINCADFYKHDPSRIMRVSVNGSFIGELKLNRLWQHYTLPFEADGAAPVTVEIDVTPLEAKHISEGDPRTDFGVCVREIEILDDSTWENDRVQDLPRWLILETTSKCNLRCQMCAITEGLVPPGHMAWETFESLRPLFPTLKRADLYGHGETFLHKRFFDMLTELREHDANVRVITNATLVKPEIAKRVVSLGLDKFIVSFDGASEALYEEIRVGAKYDDVINNIRGVMREREIQGSVRPHLQFQYMGMQKSIHEFPDFIRLAADLGAERVSLVSLHEFPGCAGQALRHNQVYARPFALEARARANEYSIFLDLPLHELEGDPVFDAEMRTLMAKAPKIIERYRDGTINSDFLFTQPVPGIDEILRENKDRTGQPLRRCYDPWNFMYVKQDGAVAPCCVTGQIMGNVKDSPAADIWNGHHYWLFRDSFKENRTPECQTCVTRPWL